MKRNFILALTFLGLIFLAAPVDAKSIIKIGRDIDISEAQTVDNVFAAAGQITVKGLVEKNLVTLGGSIVLTNTAVVRGDIVCIGGVVVQGNGAQIYGKITEVNSSNIFTALSSVFYEENDEWSWLSDIISFCFFLMLAALALLTVFLFPRPLNAVADCIRENKFKAFFWGAVFTVMIAPFFMLLIFSFIGIVLIPLAFSFILLAFILGFIAVSSLLGKIVLTKTFRYHRQSLIQETLFGLILWWIIGWLPFYIGMFIKTVVVTVGLGGVLLTIFRRGYKRQEYPVNGT